MNSLRVVQLHNELRELLVKYSANLLRAARKEADVEVRLPSSSLFVLQEESENASPCTPPSCVSAGPRRLLRVMIITHLLVMAPWGRDGNLAVGSTHMPSRGICRTSASPRLA